MHRLLENDPSSNSTFTNSFIVLCNHGTAAYGFHLMVGLTKEN